MFTLGSLCVHGAQLLKNTDPASFLKLLENNVEFGLVGRDNQSSQQLLAVPLISVNVKCSIEDNIAKVGIAQVYENKSEEAVAVDYSFPIRSEGGSFVKFVADFDGVNIKNIIRDDVTDEGILHSPDSPQSPDESSFILQFLQWTLQGNKPAYCKIPIGSLGPGSRAQIKLGYEQSFPTNQDTLKLVIPKTIVPKVNDDPSSTFDPAELSIKVNMVIEGTIDTIDSPSHAGIIVAGKFEDPQRKGWTQAQVKFSGNAVDLQTDFVLLIEKEQNEENQGTESVKAKTQEIVLVQEEEQEIVIVNEKPQDVPIVVNETKLEVDNTEENYGKMTGGFFVDIDECDTWNDEVGEFIESFTDSDNESILVPAFTALQMSDTQISPEIEACVNALKASRTAIASIRSHTIQEEAIVVTNILKDLNMEMDSNNVPISPGSIEYSIMKSLETSYPPTHQVSVQNASSSVNEEMEDYKDNRTQTIMDENNNHAINEPLQRSDADKKIENNNPEAPAKELGLKLSDESNQKNASKELTQKDEVNEKFKIESYVESNITCEVVTKPVLEAEKDHVAVIIKKDENQFSETFKSFHAKSLEALEIKKSLSELGNTDKENNTEDADPSTDIVTILSEPVTNVKEVVSEMLNVPTKISSKEQAVAPRVTTSNKQTSAKKIDFSQPRTTKLQISRANLISAKTSAAAIANLAKAVPFPVDTHKNSYRSSSVVRPTTKTGTGYSVKKSSARPQTVSTPVSKKVSFANPKPLVNDKDVSNILINLQQSCGSFELSPILTALLSQDLDNIRKIARENGWVEKSVATALALVFFTEKLQENKKLWNATYEKGRKWLNAHYPKKADQIIDFMTANVTYE